MSVSPKVKYRHDYQPPNYTISDLSLAFELDPQNTTVTAISCVQRKKNQSVPLVLAGEALTLLELKIDGKSWKDYRVEERGLVIEHVPENFTLTIVTLLHPVQNSALEGLYLSGNTFCTQCEAEGFRRITYYLDQPDVLARFRTRITADKQRYPILLANGNRKEQGDLTDGRHFVVWEDPFPKPSYLFALVAGDFDRLSDSFITSSQREVALELYVDRGNLDRANWAMASLKNAMRWDEQRFGLEYDLDIYMIVAVDFFNMGAMENKGLNIFNAKFVLANPKTATDQDYLNIESVIAHEYFHNWTGNRVTCRDWFQLSLKEGLTVFRDQEFSSDLGSRAVNRINAVRLLRSAQFAEDASPMAHPIRPDKVIEMSNFYTMTVYEKGAEVIRMMHTLLGEEKFQAGMRLYFNRHDGCAVTCDDFVQAMEDAADVDLSLFRRWYSQSGTPVLTIRDQYDQQKHQYHLQVSQYTPPTLDQAEKHPLHIPLDIELYNPQGQVIPLYSQGKEISSVLNVTQTEQTFIFDNVTEAPIVSLLREFSAPVKLDCPYTDQQLIFLMQFAVNDFARWDAAQILLNKYIQRNVLHYQQQQDFSLPLHVIDAFRGILLNQTLDPGLIVQILTMPTESEMAELFAIIDPDAIAAVRRQLINSLAQAMADEWLTTYDATRITEYRITHNDIARRSLHNLCLMYLAYVQPEQSNSRVLEQYYSASNMTDMLAALTVAVEAELPCNQELLNHFEQSWQQDGLVMDKWFALQARRSRPDVLNNVRQLMQHQTFSLANPNRVRSLIGTFCNANPVAFHALDGSGYAFLLDILQDLNQRNPQVASRLVEPLIRFRRYDSKRQALMCAVLEQLKNLTNLSSDLYEKIIKALD